MQPPLILTVNAGSSSLKVGIFSVGPTCARVVSAAVDRLGHDESKLTIVTRDERRTTEPIGAMSPERVLSSTLERLASHTNLDAIAAIGHRFVHGGPHFDRTCPVDAAALTKLESVAALDPDHTPVAIALARRSAERFPRAPQVACFDTSFFRALPRVARIVAVPHEYEAKGVRRHGFHGLSYTFLLEELARASGDAAARGRVVLAHLGSGSSMAAVVDGQPVETTMGFTPASGMMMSTRTGDIDPGVILFILRNEKLSTDALDHIVNHDSGLRGVSGRSADVRDLLAHEATDSHAADALALYCHHAKKAIGALAAVMGGVDTIVFSGGIGEHAAPIRERIMQGLTHLGPCTVHVFKTDEESIVARETARTAGLEKPR